MQKSIEEIVNETLAYYEEDPRRRAVTVEGCEYLTEDGRMCAVGRCLHENVNPADLFGYANTLLLNYQRVPIDTLLKPEYHGHSADFWRDLQDLHDASKFWSSTTGAKKRKLRAEAIIAKFSNPTN